MSGINLGNVVGLLVSATAPTKKYVIWAKPNPSNDDDYTLFKYDAIASEWKPYDVDRSYFLPAVIALGTNTLPSSPSLEDAYLIGDTPTGIAVGHAQEHALWNGYSWIFIEPKEGASCRSKTDPNATYVFNSGEWLLSAIAVTGYIPTTGTVTGYDISGDLVTEDTTLVKFGRDFTATGGSQGSWFEVQHGGGAGTIGMYSRGLGLGFTAGITVNYSGGVFIDAHNATITANNQLKLYSTAQDLWLSAANNDILMFAKNLKLPTRTTADRGTGNGYIAYNTDTNKYEGYIGGTWKDFVLGSDALPISGGTLTGFLTLHADPTNAMHAATKGYVDNAITGLNWKYAVRVATVSNITLSGTQTVDGVLVSVGDRVLVKNQSTATENGIYLVAAGAWTRTTDADTGAEIVTAAVLITTGTQANTQWTCTNSTPPTIGTTAITFGQIAGAGVYTNGTGISLIGNVFSISNSYAGQTSITTLGTIGTGTWQGTAIADAYIASAATWNAKIGPSGGTLTGALNEATIVTVASATNVDIVNISSNTAYITGTTEISTFTAGTSGMIRRVQFASALVLQGGNNIRLPNLAANITTSSRDVATFIFNSSDNIWYCVSYVRGTAIGLTANRFVFYNGTDIVTTNHIIGNDGNNITWVNDSFQTFGSGLNYIRGGTTAGLEISSQANRKVQIMCGTTSRLRIEGNDTLLGGVDHYFQNYAGTVQYGRLNTNGLLIGTGTINALTQLDLQSTTKGLGLNLVAGDLGTTRNGLVWYDTVGNLFKGVQNGGVVGLLTGSGLTTNTIPRANSGVLQDSYITEDTATTSTKPYPTVNTIPSGGGTPTASGGLRWFDNLASISDLYIYKKYAVGSNPAGWYRIIDSQNPTFPSLTVSGAEIYTNYITGNDGWRNLSTLYSGKFASIMPTKFVGESAPANTFSVKGIMMYDSAPNYNFLKSYDALEWKWLGAPNNGFILDYLGMQLGNGISRGDSSIGFTSNAKYLVKMFAGQNVSPSITLTAIVTVNGNNVTNIKMLQESSNTTQLNLTISGNRALITAPNTCDYFVRKLTSLYGGVAPTYEEKMFFSSDIDEFRWEGTKGLALGTATINASTQLDLQSTTKGLGLNLIAGNLGTTRNGLIWHDVTANLFKGVQNNSVVTFATTLNTNTTVQFGWKYTYTANTALYQMLNDTGSTKWIAIDACSIYALTLNFGTAPTSPYQVFYNKNGTGWTSFNTTDTAANTFDVSIKPSSAITLAANDTIQFRLNQGADGVSMNVAIKS